MKRICVLLLAALLLAMSFLPAVSASVPSNPLIAALQSTLGESVGTDAPGAAIVLFDGGDRVMLEGFGYADISARTLVSADTVFELGTLSGLFVYLCVRELQETGQLDADADITDYLPQETAQKLGLSYATTTNDLLYGMAGFAERSADLYFKRDSYCFDSLEEALLASVPAQEFAPGHHYAYSAFGVALAAYVVECVSGVSYFEFARERILEPLGLSDTYLDPRADSAAELRAKGHVSPESGSFSVAEHDGLSYGGLAPANGALSSAADFSRLLSHLLSLGAIDTRELGVFSYGPVGLIASGDVLWLQDSTRCFGAAIVLDSTKGRACVTLANTADAALVQKTPALLGTAIGEGAPTQENLPELKNFEGTYANAAIDRRSITGRLALKQGSCKAVATDEGALEFLGLTLRQVAPGVFADAASDSDVAVVQFLTDAEGEVTAVLTAEGESYLPVSFFDHAAVATFFYYALLLLAAFLVLGAVLHVLQLVLGRSEDLSWRFVLPWLSAALLALLALLQLWVASSLGAAALSTFFGAMSVLSLICIIVTVALTLFALFTAFTERGRSSRTVNFAIALVAFILLCIYWRLIQF